MTTETWKPEYKYCLLITIYLYENAFMASTWHSSNVNYKQNHCDVILHILTGLHWQDLRIFCLSTEGKFSYRIVKIFFCLCRLQYFLSRISSTSAKCVNQWQPERTSIKPAMIVLQLEKLHYLNQTEKTTMGPSKTWDVEPNLSWETQMGLCKQVLSLNQYTKRKGSKDQQKIQIISIYRIKQRDLGW